MAEEIKLEPCVKCGRERFYKQEAEWYWNWVYADYVDYKVQESIAEDLCDVGEWWWDKDYEAYAKDIDKDPTEFDMCLSLASKK